MIECIFTIDYEVFGDGTGGLKELVYEPARRLKAVFEKHGAKFVTFVEALEFEQIAAAGADPAIGSVEKQIRELHKDDFEIALHLHPQWANARFEKGRWRLDLSEYNLCKLPRARVGEIVGQGMDYLRHVLNEPRFAPLSFRAGNWLFQPTSVAAGVLSENGISIDSSVFKGGMQRIHGLDYRPALKNGYYWRFSDDVNRADPAGRWIEVPIHTEMVAPWRMATSKRMSYGNQTGAVARSTGKKLTRALDFLRFRYPLKLDFCRMTLKEMKAMMGNVLREDARDPEVLRPIVAIGHTKDLADFEAVDSFLAYLRAKRVGISTFQDVYPRLSRPVQQELTRDAVAV